MAAWQEQAARGTLGDTAKCETCMEKRTEQTRQSLGCGWLPLPAENLLRFRRVPNPGGYNGIARTLADGSVTSDPETCPTYTTSLPEVFEVAVARRHWLHGGPAAIGITDWKDHPLATGILILEGASNAAERWAFENPVKK